MQIREAIRKALAHALKQAGVSTDEIVLEHPAELRNGDYATGVALACAKTLGKSPRALAEEIVKNVGEIDGVEKIEIAGPGFINFYLSARALGNAIEYIAQKPDEWGTISHQKGKRVMVEYTDPNPFKEFHIGHLMSNAIGESISRLIEYIGSEVKRVNYQGDVGPHVAKALWGLQKQGLDPRDSKKLGAAYAEGARAYESNPEAKEEIDVINAKIYDHSDLEINEIYKVGREASLKHFEEIYKILGTKFDRYFFESETAPEGFALVEANRGVFVESQGAIVFNAEKYGLHTRVFITSKGLPTYEAKDLGLLKMKDQFWKFDTAITVTANEQKEYFQVVQAAMREVLPELADKVEHVTHGMMRLQSGKMSSRTGDVITGESLLNDLSHVALARAKESRAADPTELANQIAVAAIKYQVLKQKSGRDIVFDPEQALSLDGDSGPYLQYAHARASQVLERAHAEKVTARVDDSVETTDLERIIHRFPEIVEYAAEKREPHLLTTFLTELASAFNSWYAQVHILDGTAAAAHKVALTNAVRVTLKNGSWLLGISAPEKM